jgi:hypothetical protein
MGEGEMANQDIAPRLSRRAREEIFANTLNVAFHNAGIRNTIAAPRVGVSARTLGNWRRGYTFPGQPSFQSVLRYLAEFAQVDPAPLVRAYNLARPRSPVSLPSENAGARIDTEAVAQIAAAFRFGIQDNKIDALPENLETLDPAISRDLYGELVAKAQALDARLKRSNADPYAGFAVERLLQSLGARYDDVNPGVVLSRLRSIEGIVSGFGTEEGRTALFPDAIAMLTDLHLSGQDFLATFPKVRRIERERIAAGLEKDPAVIDKALEETEAIHSAAAESEIVAAGAVSALGENEPDIQEARSVEVKADLVADRLLIHRNFVSQALRAIARKSGDAWEVVGPDFVAGSKAAARMLPPLAVIALITTIAGPIAGLAGLLQSDLFKSVRSVVTTVRRSASKQPPVGAGRERPGTSEKLDLTARELAVMDLLREGKPSKQIGIELKMQESTVKVHVRNIMKKLRRTTA